MKTKKQLQEILKKYGKEAYSCLYPKVDGVINDYAWGTNRQNSKKTIEFMRKLLAEIPNENWGSKDDADDCGDSYDDDYIHIVSGNWRLKLFWNDGERHADLKYKHDDHTAWVRQSRNGKWVNFDIGGS